MFDITKLAATETSIVELVGGDDAPLHDADGTRRFHDDFTLCCVVQKFRRTPGVQYHFEVVTGPDLLDREALFAHYATGVRQKQTDFDLPAGHALDTAPGHITIIGRLR